MAHLATDSRLGTCQESVGQSAEGRKCGEAPARRRSSDCGEGRRTQGAGEEGRWLAAAWRPEANYDRL